MTDADGYDWLRGVWTTPEQQRCIDTAEPIIRAVLADLAPADLAPEHPKLALKLALVGCIQWRKQELDPDERGAIEAARRALADLRTAWGRLSPAALAVIAAPPGGVFVQEVDRLSGNLDKALERWPRRPRGSPPREGTDVLLHLWRVLDEHKVPMRAGARILAEILVRLERVLNSDKERFAESLYQRIRNNAR